MVKAPRLVLAYQLTIELQIEINISIPVENRTLDKINIRYQKGFISMRCNNVTGSITNIINSQMTFEYKKS
jgi:hypothetical protein